MAALNKETKMYEKLQTARGSFFMQFHAEDVDVVKLVDLFFTDLLTTKEVKTR